MAVVPDITELDLGQVDNAMGVILPALKDFFDSSITTVGGSSNIDGVKTNHGNGPDAQRYDYVSVTNDDGENFVVDPTTTGEDWQISFSKDSFDDCDLFIDPQGNISDMGTSPPSTSSTGTPEESSEAVGFKTQDTNSSQFVTIIELDTAAFIVIPNGADNEIQTLSHWGKIADPLLTSFGSGLGFVGEEIGILGGLTNEGQIQVDGGNWEEIDEVNVAMFAKAFYNDDPMPQRAGEFRVNLATGFRDVGITRHYFEINRNDTPGTVVDGGSGTDFVFLGGFATSTYNDIIPWDNSSSGFTPRWQ